MNGVKELEGTLILGQAQELAALDPATGGNSSTQQLLDDLLGRLEDDDSLMSLR
jgi:hypothetical protein